MRPNCRPLLSLTLLACAAGLAGAPLSGSPQAPAPAAGTAAQAPPAALTFEQIFAENRPGAWPKQLAWSPDGARLGYLLPAAQEGLPAEGGGEVLWLLEVASKHAAAVLESSALPAKEGEKAAIDSYRLAPKGDAVLVESGGDLFLKPVPAGPGATAGALRRLTSTQETEEYSTFSPDGGAIAFVRGFDLYRIDLATGREKALTQGGKENVTLNAKNDWVYWEEIWGRTPESYWWSPDGKHIAYYQFDETPVASYPLVDFLPTYPTVEWQKYPKAGQPNPKVRIGVLDVAKGKTVWLATGGAPDDYLARVHWAPGSDALVVERLNRDQTRLELVRCAAAGGKCAPFFTEEAKTWVNLTNDGRFLADGRFLWTSERTGWRQIYLYGADGRQQSELTLGLQAVTSVDAVDEAAGKVYYTTTSGAGIGAAHRMIYRVPLAGGPPEALTQAAGWNEALVAPGARHWLHSVSTSDLPPRRRIVQADGKQVMELPAGPAPSYDPQATPRFEYQTIWSLEGNKLPTRMLKPAGFDPKKKYPAIMYHYGGPASQVVANRWDSRMRDAWHRLMAQRGYVVLSVDNFTSTFFGKLGEDKVHRSFGGYNLDAQLAGIEYLKTLGYVDASRIGLWGWSGGGTNTLNAVLQKPGVWKAAVAGAPVTDWKLYDSIWTERYLDTPQDNPRGYESSSPVTYAARLEDRLLLVHGTADDNVHPQNTVVMSQAFIDAGVIFEELILPRQKHGLRGKGEQHFYRAMTDFFDRWLKP